VTWVLGLQIQLFDKRISARAILPVAVHMDEGIQY